MVNLTLIGVSHGGLFRIEGNYHFVWETLAKENPEAVTLEISFDHSDQASKVLGKALFASKKERQRLHRRLNRPKESCFGSEYLAPVVYCREKDLPLYFIDKSARSIEEVTSQNVLTLSRTELDQFSCPSFPWTIGERNEYMAQALQTIISRRDRGRGIERITHIGGWQHYSPKHADPTLQELISAAEVQIYSNGLTDDVNRRR
ncbi:hypothetical protein HYT52_00990 [Candidatus Woesearchaeota archaeon]|nr:hypothetical protein [Candidatus Woesearchaeota archaeon]